MPRLREGENRARTDPIAFTTMLPLMTASAVEVRSRALLRGSDLWACSSATQLNEAGSSALCSDMNRWGTRIVLDLSRSLSAHTDPRRRRRWCTRRRTSVATSMWPPRANNFIAGPTPTRGAWGAASFSLLRRRRHWTRSRRPYGAGWSQRRAGVSTGPSQNPTSQLGLPRTLRRLLGRPS